MNMQQNLFQTLFRTPYQVLGGQKNVTHTKTKEIFCLKVDDSCTVIPHPG